MAHYVAELIAAAEQKADGSGATTARARAAEEILRLWSHRTTMPRPYPFENFGRIFAALDRLEDSSTSNRLGRYFGDDSPTDAQLAVTPLLQLTARVDDEVSDVISCLIAEAVTYAEDADAPWVPIALKIGEDESARALRRLMSLARRHRLDAQWTEAEASPVGDQAVGDEGRVGEDAGEDIDYARREALVEAIDRATATLAHLRAVVVESLGPSDG